MLGLAPSDSTRIALDSPVPYYSQLASIILRQIEAGVLIPNDRLPSEQELEKTYGVSRTVVRHALNTLAAQRMVYRRKGKGTFAAEPRVTESLFQHLIGFYEENRVHPRTLVLPETLPAAPSRFEPAPKAHLHSLAVRFGQRRQPPPARGWAHADEYCPGDLRHTQA